MKCKHCGVENAPIKKSCENCRQILVGWTINNMTGQYGYRNSDGSFYYPCDVRNMVDDENEKAI